MSDNLDFVNILLERHQPNNFVFDNTVIELEIEGLFPTQMIKRRFWEQTMLKRINLSIISPFPGSYPHEGSNLVYMSISEAILYINLVTPPIMKKRVDAALTSIDAIESMLKMYLMEYDSSQYDYNMSIFSSMMSFNENSTEWNYDNSRLEKMHQIHPDRSIVGLVDCIDANISQALKGEVDARVQCTLEAKGRKGSELLQHLIADKTIRVVNVNIEGDIIRVIAYTSMIRSCKQLRSFLRLMHKIK